MPCTITSIDQWIPFISLDLYCGNWQLWSISCSSVNCLQFMIISFHISLQITISQLNIAISNNFLIEFLFLLQSYTLIEATSMILPPLVSELLRMFLNMEQQNAAFFLKYRGFLIPIWVSLRHHKSS